MHFASRRLPHLTSIGIPVFVTFRLDGLVVMPNHVHLLITPKIALSEIMRRLKGSSAREANKSLGRLGTFWQEESYDHLVRSDVEFGRIKSYILENPVKAGLVRSAEEFRWSSGYEGGGLKPAAD